MTQKKNQAELEIEALEDVFDISTTGFEDFYKQAKESTTGDSSKAASSGNYSKAASSGNYSKAASSGNYSTAASSGYYSACAAVGYRAAVKGDIGNLIMASEYIKKDTTFIPIGGKADLIDGKILKPNCWYIVENEKWVEVDFSDGVFSYVLSSKKGIKKVKTEDDRIMFIASDENGISAHGKSIKEATEELLFKTGKRDISEYKNMPLTAVKTPSEWALIYRMITGACKTGIEVFLKDKKLKKKYTLNEILEQTQGQFGHESFKETVIY